jgi:ubiquinone biosynthesis monooxygenase Coq7
LGARADADSIRAMAKTEDEHLAEFDQMLAARRVRPTLLHPIWHVAGFALGAGTALLGRPAAMACTAAVEEVIEQHYADQAALLADEDPELRTRIEKFRHEEIEHRETALAEGAEQAPAYPVLSAAVKTGTRLAIWLSERI